MREKIMMKLEICMGTACHLKGSREVIEKIQELIVKNKLKDMVDLSGKFCLGKCENKGVSITLDGKEFDILPEQTEQFFNENILSRVF